MMFACGYSGVRVAVFFEKLAHYLAFVVKVGVSVGEIERMKINGIFKVLWMRGRM